MSCSVPDETDSSDGYQSIECGLHSQYELAIMHSSPVYIRWKDKSGIREYSDVTLLDIFAQDKSEYLSVKLTHDDTIQIRLDRILSFRLV